MFIDILFRFLVAMGAGAFQQGTGIVSDKSLGWGGGGLHLWQREQEALQWRFVRPSLLAGVFLMCLFWGRQVRKEVEQLGRANAKTASM